MAEYVKAQQNETKVGEVDLLQAIWAAIMADVDWTAKPEQLEALALKNIKVSLPAIGRDFADIIDLPTCHVDLRFSDGTLLHDRQGSGRAHQHRAGILLHRDEDHQGIPSDPQGSLQRGLYFRPGHHLLGSKGSVCPGQGTLCQGRRAARQGESDLMPTSSSMRRMLIMRSQQFLQAQDDDDEEDDE